MTGGVGGRREGEMQEGEGRRGKEWTEREKGEKGMDRGRKVGRREKRGGKRGGRREKDTLSTPFLNIKDRRVH